MLVTLAIRRLCSASAITGAASSHIIKPSPSLIYPYGEKVTELIGDSMQVFEDYISEEEETNLMRELELTLKKLRYESSHWDHVSVCY